MRADAALADWEFLGGSFGYADIAFFMAALIGERVGAVIGRDLPQLTACRARIAARPAVRQVAGAMMTYLTSIGRPVPAFMRQGGGAG